ncbi:MAG TPA: DUF4384 domain-containing protein [Bacteroidota bacterium]|nr:DUF4384 domain-containing protein [Bacteroidota bacterium]
MFSIIRLILSSLLVLSSVAAQTVQTVTTSGIAYLTQDVTYGEAERRALEDAFSKAIAEVAGVNVQSEIYGSKAEVLASNPNENEFLEVFTVINRSVSYGRIVGHKILEKKTETTELAGGAVLPIVRVRVACEVAKDEGKPDPSFRLELDLNNEVFYDRGERKKNDEVIVTVQSTQDAYLTVFGVTNDTVNILLPNELIKNNQLKKGEKFTFPSEELRSQGFRLRVSVPVGRARATEMVLAVATKDPVEFKGGKVVGGIGIVPTYVAALDELNKWLSQIPPDRRTEAHKVYEVRRR